MGSANGALLRWLSQVLGYGDSLGTVLVDELTFADHAGRRDMEFARTLAVKVRAGGQPLFCAATRRPQSIPPLLTAHTRMHARSLQSTLRRTAFASGFRCGSCRHCPALPCPALPCAAVPCLAMRCAALRCLAATYTRRSSQVLERPEPKLALDTLAICVRRYTLARTHAGRMGWDGIGQGSGAGFRLVMGGYSRERKRLVR